MFIVLRRQENKIDSAFDGEKTSEAGVSDIALWMKCMRKFKCISLNEGDGV